jgi:hypothetical protein
MQIISSIGNAQALPTDGSMNGTPSASNNNFLLLSSTANNNVMQRYNLPVLLLGTVFVMGAAAIPVQLKNTQEGSAIYVGIQYAYSDILLMNLPDIAVKQSLALTFFILFPWLSELFFAWHLEKNAPLIAWKEAIEFAGTSFIIDCILPSDAQVPGNIAWEELLRGIGVVAIVHAVVFSIHEAIAQNDGQTNVLHTNTILYPPGNTMTHQIGQTLDSIGSFTTWRIGKRFFNLLQSRFSFLNTIHLLAIFSILLCIISFSPKYVGPSFPKVAKDMVIMIAVLKLASSVMLIFQQGDSVDAVILLFAGMVAVRLFLKFFI